MTPLLAQVALIGIVTLLFVGVIAWAKWGPRG